MTLVMPTRRRPQLGENRARQVHRQFQAGQRQQVREAREYAELWLRAIQLWEEGSYDIATPASSGRGTLDFLTSGTSGKLSATYLKTPMGYLTTSTEAGHMITLMMTAGTPDTEHLGRLLDRLRDGGGPLTLLDPRGGWSSPASRAVLYARAVLTLDVRLGDQQAEIHLKHLQNSGVSPTVLVSST